MAINPRDYDSTVRGFDSDRNIIEIMLQSTQVVGERVRPRMINQEFITHQQQMYHTMALFHEALGAYWAAIDSSTGALTRPERAQTLRGASIELEAVLNEMHGYLAAIAQTDDVTAEMAHVEIYLQALQIERGLVK